MSLLSVLVMALRGVDTDERNWHPNNNHHHAASEGSSVARHLPSKSKALVLSPSTTETSSPLKPFPDVCGSCIYSN